MPKTGLFAMKFMQNAMEKKRKEAEELLRDLENDVERGSDAKASGGSDDDDDDDDGDDGSDDSGAIGFTEKPAKKEKEQKSSKSTKKSDNAVCLCSSCW